MNKIYYNSLVNKTKKPEKQGYVNVMVFTALGALPIANAFVSIYNYDVNKGVTPLVQLTTNQSGKAPLITLPVVPSNPLLPPPEDFSTAYNLRVQAPNYYTVLITNIRVYDGITTNFNVNLTPLQSGVNDREQEEKLVIPPRGQNEKQGGAL